MGLHAPSRASPTHRPSPLNTGLRLTGALRAAPMAGPGAGWPVPLPLLLGETRGPAGPHRTPRRSPPVTATDRPPVHTRPPPTGSRQTSNRDNGGPVETRGWGLDEEDKTGQAGDADPPRSGDETGTLREAWAQTALCPPVAVRPRHKTPRSGSPGFPRAKTAHTFPPCAVCGGRAGRQTSTRGCGTSTRRGHEEKGGCVEPIGRHSPRGDRNGLSSRTRNWKRPTVGWAGPRTRPWGEASGRASGRTRPPHAEAMEDGFLGAACPLPPRVSPSAAAWVRGHRPPREPEGEPLARGARTPRQHRAVSANPANAKAQVFGSPDRPCARPVGAPAGGWSWSSAVPKIPWNKRLLPSSGLPGVRSVRVCLGGPVLSGAAGLGEASGLWSPRRHVALRKPKRSTRM